MKKIRTARLGVGSSLSPSSPQTDSPTAPATNSASLAKAERQIKALEEENRKLRDDLSEISSLYQQLVRESGHERHDERRVMALKSHILQLERQVATLAEAEGARAATLLEVENALAAIADCGRKQLGEEKAVGASVGSLSMPREDVNSMVETAESARIKLYKSVEMNNSEKLQRPLLMMDRFVKQSPWQPVTLMDVCSGRLDHLNLKHVSRLESQLSQVYEQLIKLSRSLRSLLLTGGGPANREVPTALYERLGGQTAAACELLNSVTAELLDLTLLVPAAPWPPLQKPRLAALTTDDVIKALPNFPKSKAAEGRHLIEALLKCYTLTNHMNSLENNVLKEELLFHQRIYDLQQEYIQSLLAAVKEGYGEFETSTNSLLCQPMTVILEKYHLLQSTASEEALREFITVFKKHADQIEETVSALTPEEGKSSGVGREALSAFGDQFLSSVEKIRRDCRLKRDELVADLDEVKRQRQDHLDAIKDMFGPAKGETAEDPGELYDEIIGKTESLNLSPSNLEEEVSDHNKQQKKNMARSKDTKTSRVGEGSMRSSGREQSSPSVTTMTHDGSVCSCGMADCDETLHTSRTDPRQEDASEKAGSETDSDKVGEANITQTGSQARRPSSLGDVASRGNSGPNRRTPPTPRTSRLPAPSPSPLTARTNGRSNSTPGRSRLPTQHMRKSLLPGASPAPSSRGHILPGGRLTPINKLVLKPRSGSETRASVDQEGDLP